MRAKLVLDRCTVGGKRLDQEVVNVAIDGSVADLRLAACAHLAAKHGVGPDRLLGHVRLAWVEAGTVSHA